MENFWDYSVWSTILLISVLLGGLIAGNVLKKTIPVLHRSLIPTSVLGGIVLIVFAGIYKAVKGTVLFDIALFGGNGTSTLEMITYHALALGFIASTFKSSDGKLTKKRATEIFNTGVTTVSTYLLQAVFGMAITMVAALIMDGFFSAAGILLPFGYGQGTGQALNYGNIYETQYGFEGGKSFGLTIAAFGFLSAAFGGVIHLNIMRKRGKLRVSGDKNRLNHEKIESENEIPMQESIDKMTIQVALIFAAYVLAYLLMYLLGKALPGMKATIYGFNFLLGVLSATLIKACMNFLKKKSVIKKEYTNDFLMTRASNFFFDVMVVAGIAAIRLDAVKNYWGILIILGVVGFVITYVYNRIVAKVLFQDYPEEQFLAMYGMLTGTASTGIILLREIDGNFDTPAADNLVYQNFPAIVFGFPIMLLAALAPTKPLLTWGILLVFFVVMNVILFRRQLLRKKASRV